MNNKVYLFIIIVLAFAGCKGSRPTTTADTRYQRPPLVEVSQEQLDKDVEMLSAKTQAEIGNRDSALALYSALIAKDPHYSAALYEKGRILLAMGRPDSAIVCLKKAAETDPRNTWYKMALASAYEQVQNGPMLVATWADLVKLDPENLDYRYELSNSHLFNRNIPAAIDALNQVEKMVGVTEMVSLQKQRLWDAMDKPEKGRKEIEALAAALPNETKYSAMLAESYMKEHNLDKAKQYYDQILAADPDDEYVHISLASYYKALGQQDKAAEELKQGFRLSAMPTASKLQILASLYTTEEFYGELSPYTYSILEEVMKTADNNPDYAMLYGDVLMRQNRNQEALEQFQIKLRSDSSQYEVWERILICFNMEPDADSLYGYGRRAASLFPFHQLPIYSQAVACDMKQNYEEGLRLMEQCIGMGFSNGYLEAESYALAGEIAHHMGRKETAYRYFDKSLAANPNNLTLLNNYAFYLTEDGTDLAKAEQMSRKTLVQGADNPSFLDTYAWVLHKLGRDKEALRYIQKAASLDQSGSPTIIEHLNIIRQQ